jgi:hypothetical protein
VKLLNLEPKREISLTVSPSEAMKEYLSSLSMNFIDCLHGVQVVDTRVKADFIHDDDASGFNTLL